MPPRWPRKPDRRDPSYRRLDDRMNFAVHVALFAAFNSGGWFWHQLQPTAVPFMPTVTLVWLPLLAVHALYVFAIARYAD
ncbi:hypothetical protein [Thermosynechococcus sp.]|uniref:hypothetical protein n=1 Tax=Thermosynechococcus sp. TaxID=2814275 RepID=UPI00391CD698